MELKVILYLTAGVAYFIYKQFQRLQKEAIARQVKIREHQNSTNAGHSPKVDSLEELSGSTHDLKKTETAFRENQKVVINQKVVKTSKQMESTTTTIASLSYNTDIKEEDYISDQSHEKAFQDSYSQIRNMILFNELLKRPTY